MLGINLVKVELSTRQVVFTPGNSQDFSRAEDISSPDLEVTVTNVSQQFASFQLALHAEGQMPSDIIQWYQIEPNASAKKPPGDQTTFSINLLKAPVPSYDTTLLITLKVFSAELADFEVSETFYLRILRPNKTLRIYLPVQDLSVYPGSRLRIPVLLYNLDPNPREITLRLRGKGLDLDWFPEGIVQSVLVEAGGSQEAEFWCAPPAAPHSRNRVYTITVEANDQRDNSASASNYLEIIPFGQTQATVSEHQQHVPAQRLPFWKQQAAIANFLWLFDNQSNLQQRIFLHQPSTSLQHAKQFTADELTLAPGNHGETNLSIEVKRPWLGWVRTHFFEVFPKLLYPDSGEAISAVTVNPASQMLTLKVRPIVPLWLQILIGLLGLVGLWWVWLLSPRAEHTGPVNSITLMANGDTVVSASRDQTLRRWQVNRAGWLPNVRRLRHLGPIETPEDSFAKAIRVVEHLPADVKQVAVGLESGEVQLWTIDPPNHKLSLIDQSQADRVFDLAFTKDSRFLFSGHGSGTVRQWSMANQYMDDNNSPLKPVQTLDLGAEGIASVISAIDVIEQPGPSDLVAIASQFNRLILWDWQTNQAYDILYQWVAPPSGIPPVVSRHSYLTSLDVADDDALMVTADNVGFITTWDVEKLRQCLPANHNRPSFSTDDASNQQLLSLDCPEALLDQWQAGQQGSAIREVALTANGCYLASTGDDGHISLWRLTTTGQREDSTQRINLATFKGTSLNSVDIHLTTDNVVLVAADTPDHRVQLYRKKLANHGCK